MQVVYGRCCRLALLRRVLETARAFPNPARHRRGLPGEPPVGNGGPDPEMTGQLASPTEKTPEQC